MGCTPLLKTEGGITMYNMAFRFDGNMAAEAAFIAGLELTGVRVRCNRGVWYAWGMSEDDRNYVEKNAVQFWAL